MSIACITPIRDNEDTIELFVRINSKVVDHFYFINNRCRDRTIEILRKLHAEGFSIFVRNDDNDHFDYSNMVCQSLWSINKHNPKDWYIFLDADEFLDQSKEEIIKHLELTPGHLVPKMRCRSWILLEDNWNAYDNPLWSMFAPLEKENMTMHKVIIDKRRATYSNIMFGAHDIYKLPINEKADSFESGIRYNHFPVRSSKQIIDKVFLAEQKLLSPASLSTKRITHQNFHTMHVAKIIRSVNGQIDYPLLKQIAVSYCAVIEPDGSYLKHDTLLDEKFGSPTDKMKYR